MTSAWVKIMMSSVGTFLVVFSYVYLTYMIWAYVTSRRKLACIKPTSEMATQTYPELMEVVVVVEPDNTLQLSRLS